MANKQWPLATRFLHLGMVLTISANLLISEIMAEPDDRGTEIGKMLYQAHEIIGLSALVIVLLHWAWSLASYRDGNLAHLFPWLFEGMDQVWRDMAGIFKGNMPQAGGGLGGLPGLIHGLGLLAVTGIVVSGAIYYFSDPNLHGKSLLQEGSEELHEFFAGFVWVYWIGHGGAALLHHLRGHEYVKNMFSFFGKNRKTGKLRKTSRSATSMQ